MTNKIFNSIIFVVISSILISTIFIFLIIFNYFNNLIINEQIIKLNLLSNNYNLYGIDGLKKIDFSDDIYVIDKDNNIIFSNLSYEIKNILDNEEVLKIDLEDGGKIFLYKKNIILSSLIFKIANNIIFLIVVIAIFSIVISDKLLKKILFPINNIDLDNIYSTEIYDELLPFIKKIQKQNNIIKNQINEAKSKQKEFEIITENMEEGLLILDKNMRIISFNKKIKEILEIDSKFKNFIEYNRNLEFISSIKKSLNGEYFNFRLEKNGNFFNVRINPIKIEDNIIGIVILIINITEKVNLESMRREFTQNLSHEIKTPLTSISGYAELLKEGLVKNDDILKFSNIIYNESLNLKSLIDDIICITRLETEREFYGNDEEIYIIDELNKIVEELYLKIKKNNIELKIVGKNYKITINKKIFYFIFVNLIDNAIKYNKINGKVIIDIYDDLSFICIKIKDTGIGIDIYSQNRIFERFYRVDKSHSKNIEGTGLGLSIVKHSLNYIKANIELKSTLGEGSEFLVKIKKG